LQEKKYKQTRFPPIQLRVIGVGTNGLFLPKRERLCLFLFRGGEANFFMVMNDSSYKKFVFLIVVSKQSLNIFP
jgi:hypothetical protein